MYLIQLLSCVRERVPLSRAHGFILSPRVAVSYTRCSRCKESLLSIFAPTLGVLACCSELKSRAFRDGYFGVFSPS